MFKDQNADPKSPEEEALIELAREIEEIKRYVAATYERVDNEVAEIHSVAQRLEKQLNETDRQVDKIESFERAINDIKASVQRMERKIK